MFLALIINLKKTGDCSKTENFTSLLNQKKNINVSVVHGLSLESENDVNIAKNELMVWIHRLLFW